MSNLDATQLTQLREIGEYLKQVRQEQSRSLEEISAKTYIPLRMLRAIESGHEQPLPEPVFIQGFLRRYADALGVDGMSLSQAFPIQTVLPDPEPQHETMAAPLPPTPPKPAKPRRTRAPKTSAKTTSSAQPFAVLPLLLGALAIGGIVYGISRVLSQGEQSAPITAEAEAPESETTQGNTQENTAASTLSPSPSPSPTPVASPSPSPSPSAPISVTMNLTDRSWLEVTVDGQPAMAEVKEKGYQRTWTAQERLVITAGNAGGVLLSRDDEDSEPMGNQGAVQQAVFTPEAESPAPDAQ